MRRYLDLEPDPAFAGIARRWATEIVGGDGYRGVVEVMALLVSELVTNVVVHAGTVGRLALDIDEHRLRVEVSDGNPEVPVIPDDAEPFAVRGRGLLLLRDLSDAYGFEPLAAGKVIWFELRRPPG